MTGSTPANNKNPPSPPFTKGGLGGFEIYFLTKRLIRLLPRIITKIKNRVTDISSVFYNSDVLIRGGWEFRWAVGRDGCAGEGSDPVSRHRNEEI